MQRPTTKKVNGVWYDINQAAERIAELEGMNREQQVRWEWLTKSVLALSNEGYAEWASVVLALVNKCRHESLEAANER